jgi:hypothetical protein
MKTLQFLSDAKGRRTAVVIPIEEWNLLKQKHKDLNDMEKPKKKPSDFVGCISKETAQKMISDINNSRNQWERTF